MQTENPPLPARTASKPWPSCCPFPAASRRHPAARPGRNETIWRRSGHGIFARGDRQFLGPQPRAARSSRASSMPAGPWRLLPASALAPGFLHDLPDFSRSTSSAAPNSAAWSAGFGGSADPVPSRRGSDGDATRDVERRAKAATASRAGVACSIRCSSARSVRRKRGNVPKGEAQTARSHYRRDPRTTPAPSGPLLEAEAIGRVSPPRFKATAGALCTCPALIVMIATARERAK